MNTVQMVACYRAKIRDPVLYQSLELSAPSLRRCMMAHTSVQVRHTIPIEASKRLTGHDRLGQELRSTTIVVHRMPLLGELARAGALRTPEREHAALSKSHEYDIGLRCVE